MGLSYMLDTVIQCCSFREAYSACMQLDIAEREAFIFLHLPSVLFEQQSNMNTLVHTDMQFVMNHTRIVYILSMVYWTWTWHSMVLLGERLILRDQMLGCLFLGLGWVICLYLFTLFLFKMEHLLIGSISSFCFLEKTGCLKDGKSNLPEICNSMLLNIIQKFMDASLKIIVFLIVNRGLKWYAFWTNFFKQFTKVMIISVPQRMCLETHFTWYKIVVRLADRHWVCLFFFFWFIYFQYSTQESKCDMWELVCCLQTDSHLI